MQVRIFLAGAGGAVGRALSPLLVANGYEVHGSTRQAGRVPLLESLGVKPVVLDVYDAPALTRALERIKPTIVMHQLTDLPPALDPARMADALERNARVRRVGTRNLAEAALAAGATRLIAQSIAWAYAPRGGSNLEPHTEEQALDTQAQGARGVSIGGVIALEDIVLNTPGLSGTVLRYGQLYGAHTGFDGKRGSCPLHVEAAAAGALLAMQRACGGVFNFAEESIDVDSGKARRELGWKPELRAQDLLKLRRAT